MFYVNGIQISVGSFRKRFSEFLTTIVMINYKPSNSCAGGKLGQDKTYKIYSSY